MKKRNQNIMIKKRRIMCLLMAAILSWASVHTTQTSLCAQETEESVITDISLKNKSSVTLGTEDHVVRIIGTPGENYNVPIRITSDCTVIFDNIFNYADLTVEEGSTAHIVLRGKNVLNHILAEGGEKTTVFLEGTCLDDLLTVNDIACASSNHDNNTSVSRTGANVQIDSCSVICRNLGCGVNGVDDSYWTGCDVIPVPRPGSNASPRIIIRAADLTVNGNMACGGAGISKEGTSGACGSNGGTAGEVLIDNSRVSVFGDLSIGGTGGNGKTEGTGFRYAAGLNATSCSVTICNQSVVNVSGNVSTQPTLPSDSSGSIQKGLDGVTVKVLDSSLTAKDIASGGAGHERTLVTVFSPEIKDVSGTAGGNGGTLIAQNATIICETAVCGANAGSYQFYPPDSQGQKQMNPDYTNHPLDGDGGIILAENSNFIIQKYAAEKGNRWNNYKNCSHYNNSRFSGGTISGTIYGDVITTDVTSILDGGFTAFTEIRNSKEERCTRCVLRTAEIVSGQSVNVKANDLSGIVTLSDTGTLTTWLSDGQQKVSIFGDIYHFSGDIEVVPDGLANEFTLHPAILLNIASGGAILQNTSFTRKGNTYDYTGNFIVNGTGAEEKLVIESGEHILILSDTAFELLEVKGDANVKVYVDGTVAIQSVQVGKDATLTVANSEELLNNRCSFSVGNCEGMLKNNEGQYLWLTDILFEAPGTYTLKLNEITRLVDIGEDCILKFLLPEDTYEITIDKEPFSFKGRIPITETRQMKQKELTLYVDCSKGDIIIDDHLVTLGENTVITDANVCITQTADAHEIDIKKKMAVVTFDGVQKDVSVKLPSDFHGQIYNLRGFPISEKTDSSELPASEKTDSSTLPSTGKTNPENSHTDETKSDTQNISNNKNKTEDSANKIADRVGTNQQNNQVSSSNTADMIETKKDSSANTVSELHTEPLRVESSLKGLEMVAADVCNTYKIFSKEAVSLKINRMEDTKYFYKILEKGQNNSEINWRELVSEKITVQHAEKGKRIMIKAINKNGSFIRKTMGFVIDTKKPEVKGVKSGALYTKKRTIQVSDNCGSCEVRLNGKKMRHKFTVQKKGIYWLTVLDKAGNKQIRLFAVL